MEWLRRNAILIVALDVFLSLCLFAVQGYQIHVIGDTQHTQGVQQVQIRLNAQKNNCWSHVLDTAISHAPLSPAARARLTADAHKCVKLP